MHDEPLRRSQSQSEDSPAEPGSITDKPLDRKDFESVRDIATWQGGNIDNSAHSVVVSVSARVKKTSHVPPQLAEALGLVSLQEMLKDSVVNAYCLLVLRKYYDADGLTPLSHESRLGGPMRVRCVS